MKLAHRLLLYSFSVITVLVLVVVGILDRRLGVRVSEEIRNELTREARFVAVQWTATTQADEFADIAGSALGHRVTLIAPSGVVVGDSEFDGEALSRLENHRNRPEVLGTANGKPGFARRMSPSKGDEELYVAVPTALGVARVSVATKTVDQIFSGARRDVIGAGLVALTLAMLLSVVFARSISSPITGLRDVARAMADHDFSRPVVQAPGEVGELARTLHQLSSQIEGLENMRRDFVANVSHELRTPLTIVGGFAETLVEDDPPAAARREFAGMILSNTRRMQRIVDELLDLSKIESGGWIPEPTHLEIAGIAEEVAGVSRAAAGAKGIFLQVAISAAASQVYADRTALRHILGNLVENAVRHTSTGAVTIFSESDGKWVTVGVTDTGEGIQPEHLPRIFERFYRADKGRGRDQGGTGLGLAIVRHMTEAHGGRVAAESAPGVGTTIRASFPPSTRNPQMTLPGL